MISPTEQASVKIDLQHNYTQPYRATARDVTHRNQYKTYFRMARSAAPSLTVQMRALLES